MAKQPSQREKELDVRQSPIGFFLLGIDYLTAAEAITVRHIAVDDPFHLRFELPIRHMYAHAWELCLKACLFQQGFLPSTLKHNVGHSLTAAWDKVDKQRFAIFDLQPRTRLIAERLDRYHPTKMYAYPITGSRTDWGLPYLRSSSRRFKIQLSDVQQHFGDNLHALDKQDPS